MNVWSNTYLWTVVHLDQTLNSAIFRALEYCYTGNRLQLINHSGSISATLS